MFLLAVSFFLQLPFKKLHLDLGLGRTQQIFFETAPETYLTTYRSKLYM